jgi:hypothetical protein
MRVPADDEEREPSGWNIWLTLMVVAVAFSFLVALLEYLGVLRDLGLVLSLGSIGLALTFGLTGSSQKTVDLLRFSLRGVRRDLGRLGGDIGTLRDATVRGFAEVNRGVAETTRGVAETNRGIAEVNRGLGEIAAVLRDRLPRPS